MANVNAPTIPTTNTNATSAAASATLEPTMAIPRASLGSGGYADTLFDFGQKDDSGIMNGQGAAVRKMHATTGLHEAFHWVNYDVTDCIRKGGDFESILRALIRVYVGRISAANNGTSYHGIEKAQSAGTVLAIARASAAQVYAFANNHLLSSQTVSVTWVEEEAAVPATGGLAGSSRVPAHFVAQGNNYGVEDKDYADVCDLSGLADLAKFSIASYPIVASCLMFHGHHFLSTAEESSQHLVMLAAYEKQFLDTLPVKIHDQYKLTYEEMKDLVLHKAPHPVSDRTFSVIGGSQEVCSNLKALGCTSISLRLPLKSDQQKALTSAAAFFKQVSSIKDALNCDLPKHYDSYEDLLLHAVTKAGSDLASFATFSSSERDGVLEAYVTGLQPDVALAYGMFSGYSEVMGSSLPPTLTKSVTARKSKEGHAGVFTKGYQHGQSAARYDKRVTEMGGLQGVAIGGAIAPVSKNPVKDQEKERQDAFMTSLIGAITNK